MTSTAESLQTPTESAFDALVLRITPYSEADLIVTVLASGIGKRTFLARQARKSQKRFGSSFDYFDRGRFEIKRGRGTLPLIHSFLSTKSHRAIREDLCKVSIASTLCECLDYMIHEDAEADEDYFALAVAGMDAICQASSVREQFKVLHITLSKLLELCGYLDNTNPPIQSAQGLLTLLRSVEHASERDLKTRQSVIDFLETLRASSGVKTAD